MPLEIALALIAGSFVIIGAVIAYLASVRSAKIQATGTLLASPHGQQLLEALQQSPKPRFQILERQKRSLNSINRRK